MTGRGSRLPSSTSNSNTRPVATQRRASYVSAAAETSNRDLAWELQTHTNEELRRQQDPRASAVVAAARGLRASGGMDMDGGTWDRNGHVNGGGAGGPWGADHPREATHDDHGPFFIPSYLHRSRHVHRLLQAHERQVAELRDQARLHPNPPSSKQPALSTSSSHANLNKMHGTNLHRPAVQDVIERLPPHAEEDASHPLPSRWSEDEKMTGMDTMADGTEVRYIGPTLSLKNDGEAAAVRADHPMPKEIGLYYYEVTVLTRSKGGDIAVGFSTRKAQLNRFPGWETESWGYHSDDGHSYAGSSTGKQFTSSYTSQDVIGCGVNFRTGNAFYTKNGVFQGNAFTGIKTDHLYPAVGIKKVGEHLRVNFGRTPFVFDIDRHMENEFEKVMDEINDADVSTLHEGDDENTLIQKLVGQYLAHEGYVETARAFARDVHEQQLSVSGELQPLAAADSDEDIHAVNRQKIRKSILDGDIDRALKYTSTYYPHVLEAERNKDVYFRLRCRKFIEMMRQYTDLVTSKPADHTNGHDASHTPNMQMELDEQLNHEAAKASHPPPTVDVDMDAPQELPPKSGLPKESALLGAALMCGQELQHEFGGDTRPQVKKQLHDLFAIIAYTNPAESPIGPLLDPKGRVQIAEEINGAILVSLGKPSSAALEKLCAQTEAFLDETAARTGGAVAFVNVQRDLLRP